MIENYSGDPNPGDVGAPGSGAGGNAAVALLQLGGALYQGYQDRKTSKRNVDATNAANKAEAELAYQRSVEQQNVMNAYNSPQAQMERYSQAGLNPHLIYGQGTPGNQQGIPQYQAANLEYRYQAPNYGSALQSLLPTLMSVGTWMQQMRLSQMQIDKGSMETSRVRQLVEFLTSRNPQLLNEGANRLSLFPYQEDMASSGAGRSRMILSDLNQKFRNDYGEDLWSIFGTQQAFNAPIGGLKRLEFLEQESKTRLSQAQASWSDFDITNPQAIMQMVLSGVMGMAGQQLRLSTHRSPKSTHEVEERMRGGRTKIRRRIYQR